MKIHIEAGIFQSSQKMPYLCPFLLVCLIKCTFFLTLTSEFVAAVG